jgi:hypothetical protein
MDGIFISYRRSDSRVYAGRLLDRLRRHFGDARVFMDVEGGIARGENFADAIAGAVGSVAAMVVVIGRSWTSCADERGVRRLDVPDDWVREEVRTALDRGILLLPVLVEGASMPRAADLPEVLRPLAERQAAEISDSRWDYDVGEIIKALERAVTPLPPEQRGGTIPRRPIWPMLRKVTLIAAGLIAALIAGVVIVDQLTPKRSDYAFSTDPPQLRMRTEGDAPQRVEFKITNVGKRAATLTIAPNSTISGLSPGVFTIDAADCKRRIAPGESCAGAVVFNPKWLSRDEAGRNYDGLLIIHEYGSGVWIPVTIEQSTTSR